MQVLVGGPRLALVTPNVGNVISGEEVLRAYHV